MKRLTFVCFLAFLSACGSPSGDSHDGSVPPVDMGSADAYVPPTDMGPSGPDGSIDAFMADMGPVGVDSGPPGCMSVADCNDHVDCTADTCNVASGHCSHVVTPALCASGESCDPMLGCMAGRPCATSADCADTDACTAHERCDPAARVCLHDVLDGDGDGDPPRVCGGSDCNDGDPTVNSSATETCNMVDDDCSGLVDDGLEPGLCEHCTCESCLTIPCGRDALLTCYHDLRMALDTLGCTNRGTVTTAIAACTGTACTYDCETAAYELCACPTAGRTECGGRTGSCLDTSNFRGACGSCTNSCGNSEDCRSSSCVHCGNAGETCCTEWGTACASGTECNAGTCRACGGDGQPCCSSGATCNGTAECVSGTCHTCGMTGGACCSSGYCMGSGTTDGGTVSCISGTCTFEGCGGSGQPCCDMSGRPFCFGGTWICPGSGVCP